MCNNSTRHDEQKIDFVRQLYKPKKQVFDLPSNLLAHPRYNQTRFRSNKSLNLDSRNAMNLHHLKLSKKPQKKCVALRVFRRGGGDRPRHSLPMH